VREGRRLPAAVSISEVPKKRRKGKSSQKRRERKLKKRRTEVERETFIPQQLTHKHFC